MLRAMPSRVFSEWMALRLLEADSAPAAAAATNPEQQLRKIFGRPK